MGNEVDKYRYNLYCIGREYVITPIVEGKRLEVVMVKHPIDGDSVIGRLECAIESNVDLKSVYEAGECLKEYIYHEGSSVIYYAPAGSIEAYESKVPTGFEVANWVRVWGVGEVDG